MRPKPGLDEVEFKFLYIQQWFHGIISNFLGFVNFSSWVHLTKFWPRLTLETLFHVMLKKPYLDNGLRKTTNRNSSGIWILIKFWQDWIHMEKLYIFKKFFVGDTFHLSRFSVLIVAKILSILVFTLEIYFTKKMWSDYPTY